jgi:hypothetical protein
MASSDATNHPLSTIRGDKVPEISRYYGITIRMRYNDHPPPHFHAHYSGQGITVEIETGRIEGVMSRNALQLIWSWLDLHRVELLENWELARRQEPLRPIEPLD